MGAEGSRHLIAEEQFSTGLGSKFHTRINKVNILSQLNTFYRICLNLMFVCRLF